MNKGLKVAILCSDEELGKEAYKSIGSMPTDNYIDTFVVDESHSFNAKSIEDHFQDMERILKDFMDKSDNDYFCYIADQVIDILDKKYLMTIAGIGHNGGGIYFGTAGIKLIETLSFNKLLKKETVPESLFESYVELRAKEAVNNCRAFLG